MNRQNRVFGLVVLTVALLLAACGSGDGEATPPATPGVNSAVPTLPADDGTAQASEEISTEDITVVTPDLPATAEVTETVATAQVISPTAPATQAESPAADAVFDTAGTPTGESTAAGTPPALSETAAAEESSPGMTEAAATPDPAAEIPGQLASTPDATADVPADEGTFSSPGDGTGGSGQPGEQSSTVPQEATPSASPVAGIIVEGCEVPTVPPFTGSITALVTNAEVNFRVGPSIDCDPILDTPLPNGQAVEVIGGPVTQSADGTVWLQVEVDGVPGWVSEEFVQPAE